MALEDLEEQNVLLPEDEWGAHNLETTVNQVPTLLLFLCSAAACVMAFLGDGNTLTWIGISTFFVTFFGVVWLCDRAIVKQRERFKKEKRGQTNQPGADSTKETD